MTDWVKGVVAANTHWTDNLFSLRIQADIAPFTAGQYTSLALDIAGERVAQPYSLLSAPGAQPLEFFFYTQLEGDLSRALSRKVEGDTVWVQQQPEGTLTLTGITESGKNLCLMATGTGVAPFISMLQTDQPWQQFEHVILVYAARHWADFQYQDLFTALEKRYPDRFTLLPFISREQIAGTLQGHIPDKLRSGELEQQLGRQFDPAHSHVMLCGNPGMVKDAVAVLQARGFSDNRPGQPGQLSYESYW
ncbi:ferredoxin--NADP reductase [Pseudohongiella acticola]|jgi:ferredoxin/flavodoxin---NADP+ reductase|uniref:ferredoxin--NADP reductase n=1 Tax=Pseudohongiella acticola TaxID=1524254 RepID=UPI0030EDF18F